MERYLCIHGHFYQPPRENPWLEAIEQQDSAYPYHDWNERITDECYRPNARSRILDEQGWIVRLMNNYSRISFNFGPTLLSWLEEKAPDVYEALLEADRLSMERFGGHGSALAQSHGHTILPLSNDRDRRTQIRWGLRDFEHRFGRRPEGMWLPEAAVNTATLEILAEEGIRFTILAPRQAKRVRKLGHGGRWRDLNGDVDPTMAYEAKLPSGRSIALFFYDGPISQGVAFEGLLNSGEMFAERLLTGFDDKRTWPQLMHIATDGETYGHHHRHGDMALAYALDHIESNNLATLTNYGWFLEQHPPTHQVEIHDDSSWSCAHGVRRWMMNCGCNTGMRAGWSQEWREPLRNSLDWLRDTVGPLYEQHAGEFVHDPWTAREDYITLILDRSRENLDAYFNRNAKRGLSESERTRVLKLLELQRHTMLMYTSCGWFFDELSGIETVQVIQYAGRVIQLAQELFHQELEEPYLQRLEQAQSNVPAHGNGRSVYEKFVKPAFVDLLKVGAHYGISSLFEQYGQMAKVYCYDVRREDLKRWSAGRAQLLVARAKFTSRITLETDFLSLAALHLGEHVVNGGVRHFESDEAYSGFASKAEEAFNRADFTAVLHIMDEAFGSSMYSLGSLFRDEQRRVANLVLESTIAQIEGTFRQIYESYAPLTRYLTSLNIPAPRAIVLPAEFVINLELREGLAHRPLDVEKLVSLVEDAKRQSVQLDHVALSFAFEQALERLAERLRNAPDDLRVLDGMRGLVELIHSLPFDVDLAEVQNAMYALLHEERPRLVSLAAESNDESARQWISSFDDLCGKLRVRVS